MELSEEDKTRIFEVRKNMLLATEELMEEKDIEKNVQRVLNAIGYLSSYSHSKKEREKIIALADELLDHMVLNILMKPYIHRFCSRANAFAHKLEKMKVFDIKQLDINILKK